MTDNAKTVAAMYEAFRKGEIAKILDQMAADVDWEPSRDDSAQKAGVRWLQPHKGPKGVAEFFEVVRDMEFTKFNVLTIMGAGNKVAAELEITATIRSSGRILDDQEMHLWTFNDAGKVTRFRHYLDTAKHIEAAKP
jgi:uncharacterized protein